MVATWPYVENLKHRRYDHVQRQAKCVCIHWEGFGCVGVFVYVRVCGLPLHLPHSND